MKTPSSRCSLLPLLLGLLLAVTQAAPASADDSLTSAAPAKASAEEGQDGAPSLDVRIARYKADPTNLELGLDLLLGGDLSGKDRRKVQRAIQSVLRQHPEEIAPRFLSGLALGSAKGVDLMARALAARPEALPEVLLEAWTQLRDLSESERVWPTHAQAAKEVARRSKTPANLLVLAEALARLPDRGEDALRAYGAVIAEDPDNLTARTDLALLLAERGDDASAIEMAEKTVQRFPDSATAFLYLGMVRSMGGDMEGGREAYAKALTCTDRDADALAAVAAAYTELEDYEHAAEALEKALAADPKHVGALTSLGVLDLEQGRPKEALKRLKLAAKAAPGDARIQFLRGVAYERCERFADAASAYKLALRLQPKRVVFALALARALEAKGSAQTAATELRRALRYAPDDVRVHLQLGLVEMRRRRYGPALDALTRATQLAPKDPTPWFFIAVIQGDHRSKQEAALESLRRYKELGGSEPTALAWLESIERSLGTSKKKKKKR